MLPTVTFAAGDGHGSPIDLIPPAINFFLLFGFLVYKLKKPIQNAFIKKAKDISDSMDRANVKAKEAQAKLEIQKNKLLNLDKEIISLKESTEREVQSFEKRYKEEIDLKSMKLKQDAALKLEAERKANLNKMNTEMVDLIISSAKLKVKQDQGLKNKINNKIVQGIN
jgi:F-type H+-transporting ATPase subunit b